MPQTVLAPGRVAVVTGAASGIGLAACKRFASFGMKVCMADITQEELSVASEGVAALTKNGRDDVLVHPTDVGKKEDLESLKDAVYNTFGEVGLLMNNAATRLGGGPWKNYAQWQDTLNVNMWGVINGVHTFIPAMLAQGTRCIIVNTGSKQGITNPPGNTAYNVAKAAVKAYTEGLQHELRSTDGCQITAHLLVPGWTTTGKREHQPGAWMPDQVIDVLVNALQHGDFYVICPDDDVTPEMDRKRILWAAGDLVDNRPALSRWHPDYADAFEKFSA